MSKSKARKLAEFLRNLTDDAKINTSAVQQDNVVTSRLDLESKANDTEALVTAASVTSFVDNKLGDYVHDTHDIHLTFTGDVAGSGTIVDMGDTSINLSLNADTLPNQAGYSGQFLTTDGTSASWASVDLSNYLTAQDIPTYVREAFIAAEGQTSFSIVGGYTPSHVQVYYNGVLLSDSDYTATNGSTVVFADNSIRAGDEIVVISSKSTVPSTSGLNNLYFTANGVTKILSKNNPYFQFNSGSNISVSYSTNGSGSESDPFDITISHADTSSASSQNNTGTNKFIQTLLIDGNGHVTGVQTKDLFTDFRLVQKDYNGKVTLNAGNIEDALGRDYVEQSLMGAAVTNFPSDGQILSYENNSLFWIDPPVAQSAPVETTSSLFRVTAEGSLSGSSVILSPDATPTNTSSNTLVVAGAYTNNGSFDPSYTYCCWNDNRSNSTMRVASSNYSSYSSNSTVSSNNGLYFTYSPNSSAAIGFVSYVDSDGWDNVSVTSASSGTSASVTGPARYNAPTQEGEVYLIVGANLGDGSNLYLSSGVTLDSSEYFGGATILKLTLNQNATQDNWFIDWNYYAYASYVYSYVLKEAY